MIKPWHVVPLLATVAVGVSVHWWQSESDRWVPPQARRPDLPKLEPMPQPVRVNARQALERPVFWSSRRPMEIEDKKSSLSRELSLSRLTAVLESGHERVAILQRADGTVFKITGETQPWRIESFDGRKAVFSSADAGTVERPLDPGSPSTAKSGPTVDRARKPAAMQ